MNNLTKTNNQLSKVENEIINNIILKGDLSGLSGSEKTQYYKSYCESLGLNPLTQPFEIIKLQGKERLYAKKEATEQLRKIYDISVIEISNNRIEDVLSVTVKVKDKDGRTDIASGIVPIANLRGEALANALMKAETKAKRRATLSICGLGLLDESETDTITDPIEFKGEEVLRNYTKEIEDIKTNDELKKYWELLNDVKKKELKTLVNNRKKELTEKKEVPDPVEVVYQDIPADTESDDEMPAFFSDNKYNNKQNER